jgi:hypothetical protein
VLALTNDTKPILFEGAYGILVVDARDLGHD